MSRNKTGRAGDCFGWNLRNLYKKTARRLANVVWDKSAEEARSKSLFIDNRCHSSNVLRRVANVVEIFIVTCKFFRVARLNSLF